MAFWIVYQGNSWDRARRGGYLWAPKIGKKGQTQSYWATMERVRPGDLIFSGVNNALRAIAEATVPAYTAERPDPMDDPFWYGDGWRLDVTYVDLPEPSIIATGYQMCWMKCHRFTRPFTAPASRTKATFTISQTA